MGGHHSPIRRLVKLHPQLVQPQNGLRRLRHQLVQKLLFGGKVTATVGVQEMNGRRIIGLIRSLDPSLGHHGVGVPHPELGDQQHRSARVLSLQGRRTARSAAADD